MSETGNTSANNKRPLPYAALLGAGLALILSILYGLPLWIFMDHILPAHGYLASVCLFPILVWGASVLSGWLIARYRVGGSPAAKCVLGAPGLSVIALGICLSCLIDSNAAGDPSFINGLLSMIAMLTIPSIAITYLAYRWTAHDLQPISESTCWRCHYDLTGNESGRCPECGEPTPTWLYGNDDNNNPQAPQPDDKQ